MNKDEGETVDSCNCTQIVREDTCHPDNDDCPIEGRCMSEVSVVYGATNTRLDTDAGTTYAGMTGGPFKVRWNAHNRDFRKEEKRTSTTLSKYIWSLKDENIPYHTTWRILDRGPTYNPVTGVCRLCTKEKYQILVNKESPAELNKRSEIFSHCRHMIWKTLLHYKA